MDYKKYNDYELLYMVRENDDASRNVLYEKYQPIIKKIANEFYLRFSSYGYDYDDFIQEANIAFQRSIIHYNEDKNNTFYTFSILCVRRSLLSFCRKISNSRKNISNVEFVDIDECNISDVTSDIFQLYEHKQLENIFREIILELPLEVSCIFELKFNGFTYHEIGILLDIPSSTAEFKNRTAKRHLIKQLKQLSTMKTI